MYQSAIPRNSGVVWAEHGNSRTTRDVKGVQRIQLSHSFHNIISRTNLLAAWQEFKAGKRQRHDVQEFEARLMDNLISLHDSLASKTYRHGGYEAFRISDPKPRQIHKATVRDRVLHHAVYRCLYPFFDRTFIADSFSCREKRGTRRALRRFHHFARKVSCNNTRTCWILKCDIRQFFASIDQNILLYILSTYIPDQDVWWLLEKIIFSFHSTALGKGLPLGNLTSQLLVNIYMNEFDQYVKHKLNAEYYLRYSDDFVFLSPDKQWLAELIPRVEDYLLNVLRLSLHPNKVFTKTLASGADFLGWVHFCNHRVLRTSTARRMKKRLHDNPTKETMASYLGLPKHGNTKKLQASIKSGFAD